MTERSVDNGDELLQRLEKQWMIDRAPFRDLRIADTKILDTIEGRSSCDSCHKSRKFFCYTCCVPVIDRRYFPRVKVSIANPDLSISVPLPPESFL